MAGTGKSNRGFASMDREKQRQIASKGGQSVPPEERSFSKDPALAASAGRKGGQASHGARAQGSMNSGGASSGGQSASSGGHGGQSQNESHGGGEAASRKGGHRPSGGDRAHGDR